MSWSLRLYAFNSHKFITTNFRLGLFLLVLFPALSQAYWPTATPDSAIAISDEPVVITVLDNDIGDGLELTTVNTTTTGNGQASINSDKLTVTYRSASNFVGTDTFWYAFQDSEGRTNAQKVTVEVSAPEVTMPIAWPVATADSTEGDANSVIVIPVLENDEGIELTLIDVNLWIRNGGSVVINDDKKSVSYTPKTDFTGVDSFWYVFADNWERTNAAKVTVIVKPTYLEWPTANNDEVSAVSNEPLVIAVLDNDIGSGLELTTVNTTSTGLGTVVINDDKKSVTYTSAIQFNGVDSFWYNFEDDQGRKNAAQVFVDVAGGLGVMPSAWPSSTSDYVETTVNSTLEVQALENDSGVGLKIVEANTSSVALGSVVISADGQSVTYNPAQGFMGEDSFWYAFEDAWGRKNAAQVFVTVINPSSNGPVTSSLIPQTGDSSFQDYDDGYHKAGVARSYTRHDTNETVTDNATGLIWQDDEDAGALQLSWDDAYEYCRDSTLAGIENWRLPERLELIYLLDFSRENRVERDPLIDDVFENAYRDDGFFIRSYDHWTNEAATISGNRYALAVGFQRGTLSQNRITDTIVENVRCVSGEKNFAPALLGGYNNVVVDVRNRLMWQDDTAVKDNQLSWPDALNYCENLELEGASDWRLPNVNEAHTIIKEISSSSTGSSAFSNVHNYTSFNEPPYFWTSSTYSGEDQAWMFYVYSGNYKQYYSGKTSSRYVRCVRDYKEPVAVHGGDQTITEGESVTFDGTASYDEDGEIVSYRWFNRTTFSDMSTDPVVTFNNLTEGEYVIALQVTDNHGLYVLKDFTLAVLPGEQVNLPPVAKAGEDQSVTAGDSVTLDGNSSSDSDGTIASFEWKEGAVVLSVQARFVKADFSVGVHQLELTVTDDGGLSHTDTVTISVEEQQVNLPPVAEAGEDQSITVGNSVTLNANSSTDSDGTIASFEWKEGTVVLSTEVNFVKSDFSVGVHQVQLTVTDDDGLSHTDIVTITVSGQEEPGEEFLHELSVCLAVDVTDDTEFSDKYPDDNIAWTGNNFTDVQEIEDAFNDARLIDDSVQQFLKMPSQTVWNSMSVQEQGLYLINSERKARGIKPYEGVNQNVVAIAQYYSDYIRENNQVIGHYNDGNSPAQRLNSDSLIEGNVGNILPESVFSSYGASGTPTASASVVEAIYYWTYFDKFPLSGAAWGHRDQILQTSLNDDSGRVNQEGLLGFGVSLGSYDPDNNNASFTGVVVTLNSIDPEASWDHTSTITTDIDAAQMCNSNVAIEVNEPLLSNTDLALLTLSPSDIYLTIGDSDQLNVEGEYDDGSKVDLTGDVTFNPDIRSIVDISAGTVTALRLGTVYISATSTDRW